MRRRRHASDAARKQSAEAAYPFGYAVKRGILATILLVDDDPNILCPLKLLVERAQVKGTLRFNHDVGGNLLVGVFC